MRWQTWHIWQEINWSNLDYWTLSEESDQPLWVSGYEARWRKNENIQPTSCLSPLLILLRISEAQTEATCWGSNFAKLTFCFAAERPAGVIIVRQTHWVFVLQAEYLERWSDGDDDNLQLFGTEEMTQTLIVHLMTQILGRIRYLLFVKIQETLLRNINLNWNKFLYEDFPLNI